MKRLLFTFLFFVITLSTFSQNAKIDTLISIRWINNAWENYEREIYNYDVNCRLNTDLNQAWDTISNTWENRYLTTYHYTSGSNPSDYLQQYWDTLTNTWKDVSRGLYTYDGSFRLLTYTSQIYFLGMWRNSFKAINTYDNNGYEDSSITQFSYDGTTFENTGLSAFINNLNGTVNQQINENWSSITSSWDNESQTIFWYNADKTVSRDSINIWNSTNLSWDVSTQNILTYNGTGKIISVLGQKFQEGQWLNQSLTLYTYDANGYLINYLAQGWNGSNWVNASQTNYTNDHNGNVKQEVFQDWDANSNNWMNNSENFFTYSASCLLPLKLLEFTASLDNDIVSLNWKTTEEVNTAYFEVQRSLNAVDFVNIGDVTAKNNNGVINKYVFSDNVEKISGNNIYYRLKLVDKDGSFTYSNIAPILFNGYAGSLKIYPNPAKNQLFALFNLQTINKAELRITDITGKIIYSKSINKNQNNGIMNLDISFLTKGIYYVTLITDNTVQKAKFLKQ